MQKTCRYYETLIRAISQHPAYAQVLSFYKDILDMRIEYAYRLQSEFLPVNIPEHILNAKMKNGFPLIDIKCLQYDSALMNRYFLKLLTVRHGLPEKKYKALKSMAAKQSDFKKLIKKALHGGIARQSPHELLFFLKETINPLLELHASFLKNRPELQHWAYGYCPICGNPPILGILTGDENKKYLVCGSCKAQWPYPRLKCSGCRTENPVYLSYFKSKEDSEYRIEICDNCNTYLKIIDLRQAHRDIYADIENLVTLHLDIIAHHRGYNHDPSFIFIPAAI